MTRKDYELIARVLSRARTNAFNEGRDTATCLAITRMFCDELGQNDPNFNSDKFQVACMGK